MQPKKVPKKKKKSKTGDDDEDQEEKHELLVPLADAPATLIARIIKTCSVILGWDQTGLQWCLHALRHGGVQYLEEWAEAAKKRGNEVPRQKVLDAMHLTEGTKKKTYGRTLEQRKQTVAKRNQATLKRQANAAAEIREREVQTQRGKRNR